MEGNNWGKAFRGFKFLLERPYRLFVVIAAICLFMGGGMLHSSYDTKNYIQSTGQICNVTSKEAVRNGRQTKLYEYDLLWSFEGQTYRKHYKDKEKEEAPKEGECKIWIRPDNREVILGDPEELKTVGFKYLLFCAASGILALVFWLIHVAGRRESTEERMERLEDRKIYSVVGFIFCMIGIGIAGFEWWRDVRKGVYPGTACLDFIIFCAVIAAGCVAVFIATKKKSEK